MKKIIQMVAIKSAPDTLFFLVEDQETGTQELFLRETGGPVRSVDLGIWMPEGVEEQTRLSFFEYLGQK